MLMQLFEAGFDPAEVFEMLRAGELQSYLDDIAGVEAPPFRSERLLTKLRHMAVTNRRSIAAHSRS